MANEVHSRSTRVHFAGYELSAYLRSANTEETIDTADSTTFTDAEAKRYIAGLEDGTFSAEGLYNNAEGSINEALDAAKGQRDVLLTVWPEGDAVGEVGEGLAAIENSKSHTSSLDDLVRISLSMQSSLGVEALRSLHAMEEESASGDYGDVDAGAESIVGAVGYLHVEELIGSLDVVIQESVDGVTWTDLIEFATVDALDGDHTYQRIVVPGSVDRHLQAISTITTGPATFAVAVGRQPTQRAN